MDNSLEEKKINNMSKEELEKKEIELEEGKDRIDEFLDKILEID